MSPVASAKLVASTGPIGHFDVQRQRARLEKDIEARIHAVLKHGQFVLGPEVDQVEKALAAFAGAPHAIGVSSGRDALAIGLMALKVGPGDAVFVPGFTFSATAGAVVAVGATPVFVDVHLDSYNMNADDLDVAIREVRKEGKLRPKVVMPVDLYGLPADYPAIARVAAEHGVVVFADAAQSFGGEIGGKRVGALCPISATSFYPTKPLGCYGDGGAILTTDPEIDEAVRQIRSHGRAGDGDAAMQLGVTGRLDSIQAAVLLSKLEIFEAELTRRREIAKLYGEALGDLVETPKIPAGYESAFAIYNVRVADRDGFRDRMTKAGVGTGMFYKLALHQHPAFAYLPRRPLPVSEKVCQEVASLPIFPDLTNEEVGRVIDTVRTVLA
jgi:dTDP-4-amino-4,6-dideoxygalactose transaminase